MAQEFTKVSGLLSGKGKDETAKMKAFFDAVKSIGLSINEKVSESNRKYEICDSENNVVGYINNRNNLTFVTDDKRIRNALSNAFDSKSRGNSFILPPFVEKLKNSLKEMGLVLKANFGTGEPQYKIQEPNGTVIGTMDNDASDIQYSKQANIEHVQNIEQAISKESPASEQPLPERNTMQAHNIINEISEITSQDIFSILSAISKIPGIKEHIPNELQNKIDSVMTNDTKVNFTTEVNNDNLLPIAPAVQHEQPVPQSVSLTPHQEKALGEFNTAFEMLQTFQGLNSTDAAQISENMIARFGTDDKDVFVTQLMNGKFKDAPSLNDKITDAQAKADMINQKSDNKTIVNEKEI